MLSLRSDILARLLPAMAVGLILSVLYLPVPAQQLSNIRTKWIPVSGDSVIIDSLSIIPGSAVVEGRNGIISAAGYSLDEWRATLRWKQRPADDSVRISYRVFPVSLSKSYYHKKFEDFNRSDSLRNVPVYYTPKELYGSELSFGNLDYNGSFARGVTFGNNQDLVVNSSFNLQLQGRIAGDVDVLAAMSDNNIPIQPSGNTQQIQDFDKIFVQFRKNKTSLTVGDYELSRPAGYFMNFYKKLQGGSFTTASNQGTEYTFKTSVSAAVSKGKYARNAFQGQEGNQGPYRLTGNNGEIYIVVLAGTERIFIDGQLMVRGADRDYVIDYNAGEITFSPTRLITKDKRIEVEFQYSNDAYLRTTFYAGQEVAADQWKFRFNFYNEQDAKNQPLQQTLTDTQKVILQEAGDSVENAFVESVDSVPFTFERPLYKKTDSLGYAIYVYSSDPDSAHYAVDFSYVGANKGNYVISDNLVNGRVYQWVAPVNEIPRGQYEPIVPLIAPQRTQMLTAGGDYMIGTRTTLTAEGALSNNDVNTFSDKGNSENVGFGIHLGAQHKIPLDTLRSSRKQILLSSQYEFAGSKFKPLERYRPVEFVRDWNIQSYQNEPANENLVSVSAAYTHQQNGIVQYAISYYNRESTYNGLLNTLSGNYLIKGFRANWMASYLMSDADTVSTRFLRPTIDLSQRFNILKGITIGVRGEQEHNVIRGNGDSLSRASFYYNEGRVYLKSNDTVKLRFNADAASRIDYVPSSGEFRRSTVGNTANIGAGFFGNPSSILQLTATFRNLKAADTSLTTQQEDQSALGRITYDLNVMKGFLTSNTLLEYGAGQEPKLEYAFAKVPDGTGTHTWIDYNEDGIQQINEFEVAAFQSDAGFIKIFLPTNEYVKAYTSQFNESFGITPARLWRNATGFRSVISRFSALATLQTNKKTLKGDFATQFNPFFLNVDDSLLLTTASILSAFLYFNKTSSKFGADLYVQNNRAKNLLTNGVEIRTAKTYGTRIRWNFSRKFSLNAKGTAGITGYATEYYPQNDYSIDAYAAESQLIFQSSNMFRLSLAYGYGNSKNTLGEAGEKAVSNKVTTELKYNVITKSELVLTGSFIRVEYNGAKNAPVTYAMLQGLQDGNNLLLNISFERKLSRFIEIILSYEGRKTGSAKFINTGQAQIRALF